MLQKIGTSFRRILGALVQYMIGASFLQILLCFCAGRGYTYHLDPRELFASLGVSGVCPAFLKKKRDIFCAASTREAGEGRKAGEYQIPPGFFVKPKIA